MVYDAIDMKIEWNGIPQSLIDTQEKSIKDFHLTLTKEPEIVEGSKFTSKGEFEIEFREENSKISDLLNNWRKSIDDSAVGDKVSTINLVVPSYSSGLKEFHYLKSWCQRDCFKHPKSKLPRGKARKLITFINLTSINLV